MPAKSKLKVTPSSGNVFRDLGFSKEEAEHLVIRADLLIQIQKVVTARRLKQAPLAKLLQVSQPRVSDLLRGRLHLFSIETLIDMLGRLGVQVRFVVKPTHGSGWVRIVLDKAALDVQELISTCNYWLATNYYNLLRERHYRQITPRIMVEEFIDDGSGSAPVDYKFYTFHGKVHLIQIDGSRFTSHRCSLYDRHWRDTGVRVQLERFDGPVHEPVNLGLMLQTAQKLSADLDFVRVDLYDVGSRIYFGEMTATPGGGLARFEPQAMDEHLGKLWGRRPARAQIG